MNWIFHSCVVDEFGENYCIENNCNNEIYKGKFDSFSTASMIWLLLVAVVVVVSAVAVVAAVVVVNKNANRETLSLTLIICSDNTLLSVVSCCGSHLSWMLQR